MAITPFSGTRLLLFIAFSLFFLFISRKALRNPRCHGFYRFFVFEGVLFVVLHNHPFWFVDILSPRQLLSWLLLAASISFVIQGLLLLRKLGGSQQRNDVPENFAFENTAALVTTGIYRYVRHPMYSSLLFLTWGALLKHISLMSLGVAVLTSISMYLTGLMEEKENQKFFGPSYTEYQKRTKMFLPFIV